jgi:hypothetical protein
MDQTGRSGADSKLAFAQVHGSDIGSSRRSWAVQDILDNWQA